MAAMAMKTQPTKVDGFSYWNWKISSHNEPSNSDEDERSIALSVKLLSKHTDISQRNTVQLPSHLVESPHCQCHRLFHIFCTDLFHEKDDQIEMINIHPAPRIHDRDSSRRLPTPYQKNRPRISEDTDRDTIITTRSEPCHVNNQEIHQTLEKKLNLPSKYPPMRTTSLNIPPTHANQRALQTQLKYSPSFRVAKRSITPVEQLEVRALSVFDQSPSTSQLFIPRGPPPSPKTPTLESSTLLINSINPAPLRAISITPCIRTSSEVIKRPTGGEPAPVIIPHYEDHAREYLSASDCSEDENDDDDDDDDDNDHTREPDKHSAKVLRKTKTQLPTRSQSLAKPGARLRDRLLAHTANRYLSLAEVYYSSLDAYKNLTDKTRRRFRSQTRLMTSTNDNDDAFTTTTKTTTATATTTTTTTMTTTATRSSQIPQSKTSFGFAKTASSMHFGYAAGRLGLRGSFEKWPQPLSHRTPIERKQEVTTLRLVTLPLVTS